MNFMNKNEFEDDFGKALLITTGYLALFSLFILIPLIGFVIAFTLGAYIAGYRGSKYSIEWKKIALFAPIIWTSILISLVIFLIIPSLPFNYPLEIGGLEILLIIIQYAMTIIFCAMGARARFKQQAEYL
jgi:uncharacterized protein YacL